MNGQPDYNEDAYERGLAQDEAGWFTPVTNVAWSVLGLGKRCCSMRDHNIDDVAAEHARTHGRPPSFSDDEAKVAENGGGHGKNVGEKQHEPLFPDPLVLAAPPVPSMSTIATKTVPGGMHDDVSNHTIDLDNGYMDGESENSERMPKHFQWPAWSLNNAEPCIEVFVMDDESGQGQWCPAEPQSRVVDFDQQDAYLCAEYLWEGDYYIQDFGPRHVRKRGSQICVLELLQKERK